MDSLDVRRLARRWAVPVTAITIIGAGSGYAVSKMLPKVYASSGSVLVLGAPRQATNLGLTANQATSTDAALMTERPLLSQVIDELHLTKTPDELAKEIVVSPQTDTALITVTVSEPNGSQAASIANALMTDFVSSQGDSLKLASSATVQTIPASPKPLVDGLLGGFAGLMLGLALAVGLSYLDEGLRSEGDVREKLGLTTLAVVPRSRRKDGKNSARETSAAAEAYRRLRTNLLFSSVDRPLTSVVVTSVSPGEGKTRTAANLAAITAAVDQRVLLVDADMRRPRQHTIFGQAPQDGMSEYLLLSSRSGTAPEVNGRHKTEHPNLSLLAAGTIPPNPAELLASKHLAGVVRGLERQFDLVVFDTPPASLVTDALTLGSKTSGVIIVVESGKTKARQVRATVDALRGVGANVIGVVLNKMERRSRKDGYGYGYGYGYSSTPTRGEDGDAVTTAGWVPVDDAAPKPAEAKRSPKSRARALPAK